MEGPLFKSLDLSEMSVPLSLTNIDVSSTMSMTAYIFTLICISIIFYEIFKYTDGALHQPDVAFTHLIYQGCGRLNPHSGSLNHVPILS